MKTKPAGTLVVGDCVIAENGEKWKVAVVTMTGAKTMLVAFDKGKGPFGAAIDVVKLKRRALVRVSE